MERIRAFLRFIRQKVGKSDFRRSLRLSGGMSLAYALFYLVTGLALSSAWTISQGAYQLTAALLYLNLLGYERKICRTEDAAERQAVGWRGFRASGIWLLVQHLTMTGLVFQMVWRGEARQYPGYLIYAVAAYAFYKLTMAILRAVKCRQNFPPLWGAAKNIALSEALMNMLFLQSAMLAAFSTSEQTDFRQRMCGISGGIVCLMTVGGAVGMIAHGQKRGKESIGEMKNGKQGQF